MEIPLEGGTDQRLPQVSETGQVVFAGRTGGQQKKVVEE